MRTCNGQGIFLSGNQREYGPAREDRSRAAPYHKGGRGGWDNNWSNKSWGNNWNNKSWNNKSWDNWNKHSKKNYDGKVSLKPANTLGLVEKTKKVDPVNMDKELNNYFDKKSPVQKVVKVTGNRTGLFSCLDMTPKVATPEVASPKAESPKVATPKAASPKAASPKVASPKAPTLEPEPVVVKKTIAKKAATHDENATPNVAAIDAKKRWTEATLPVNSKTTMKELQKFAAGLSGEIGKVKGTTKAAFFTALNTALVENNLM